MYVRKNPNAWFLRRVQVDNIVQSSKRTIRQLLTTQKYPTDSGHSVPIQNEYGNYYFRYDISTTDGTTVFK